MADTTSGSASVAPAPGLGQLAEQINGFHRQCVGAVGSALEHARQAGELLIRAKAAFSERTAQNYMRVAQEWDRLAGKSAAIADLTYRGAVELLGSSPDGTPPQVIPLPDIREGYSYLAVAEDGRSAEVALGGRDATGKEYVYVGIYAADLAWVDYAKWGVYRPHLGEWLAHHSFVPATDWEEEPCQESPPWFIKAFLEEFRKDPQRHAN
ncbi:MAG TPA: hypothetical protein VFW33_04390 [Gemmataceae bacterium]|nr:hypothetical protein [Gemmataceae bacterium]